MGNTIVSRNQKNFYEDSCGCCGYTFLLYEVLTPSLCQTPMVLIMIIDSRSKPFIQKPLEVRPMFFMETYRQDDDQNLIDQIRKALTEGKLGLGQECIHRVISTLYKKIAEYYRQKNATNQE